MDLQALQDKWAQKELWTIGETWALYNDEDPDLEAPADGFIRKEANLFPGVISYLESGSFDMRLGTPLPFKNVPHDLIDIIIRSSAAGRIRQFRVEGSNELYFEPKKIVRFLIEHTSYTPSKALITALKMDREKAQPISMPELKTKYKKYVKDCTEKKLMPSWKADQTAMTQALGKKPTDKQIKQIRAEIAPKEWTERGRRKRG